MSLSHKQKLLELVRNKLGFDHPELKFINVDVSNLNNQKMLVIDLHHKRYGSDMGHYQKQEFRKTLEGQVVSLFKLWALYRSNFNDKGDIKFVFRQKLKII